MGDDVNWFHVYDSTNSLWLHEGNKKYSWGPYHGSAEFPTYELAEKAAIREIKASQKGPDRDAVVIILGDYGQPTV